MTGCALVAEKTESEDTLGLRRSDTNAAGGGRRKSGVGGGGESSRKSNGRNKALKTDRGDRRESFIKTSTLMHFILLLHSFVRSYNLSRSGVEKVVYDSLWETHRRVTGASTAIQNHTLLPATRCR